MLWTAGPGWVITSGTLRAAQHVRASARAEARATPDGGRYIARWHGRTSVPERVAPENALDDGAPRWSASMPPPLCASADCGCWRSRRDAASRPSPSDSGRTCHWPCRTASDAARDTHRSGRGAARHSRSRYEHRSGKIGVIGYHAEVQRAVPVGVRSRCVRSVQQQREDAGRGMVRRCMDHATRCARKDPTQDAFRAQR